MVSILFQKKQSVILVSKIVLVEFLQVLVCILSNEHRWSTCVLVCFSWQLFGKVEQIHKMTLKIVLHEQSCDFEIKWLGIWEFAQLYIKVIIFSAWDKSRDLGANWSKLNTCRQPKCRNAMDKMNYSMVSNLFRIRIYFCVVSSNKDMLLKHISEDSTVLWVKTNNKGNFNKDLPWAFTKF